MKFDDLISSIDTLASEAEIEEVVNWQLTDSPAAKAEGLRGGGGWIPEEVRRDMRAALAEDFRTCVQRAAAHHLNGDSRDNRPENLLTMPGREREITLHRLEPGQTYYVLDRSSGGAWTEGALHLPHLPLWTIQFRSMAPTLQGVVCYQVSWHHSHNDTFDSLEVHVVGETLQHFLSGDRKLGRATLDEGNSEVVIGISEGQVVAYLVEYR